MAVIRLTQQFVASATCPPDVKRIEYVDTEARGMYYLLSSATLPGQGTFFLRSKINHKTVHSRLGRANEIDLATARAEAKRLAVEIASGRNPQAEARAKTEGMAFRVLFKEHYLPYVQPRKRSWRRDEELFRLRLEAEFGDLKLDKISRQHLQRFHTKLLESGLAPATCDHHLKLMKHVFNLALDWNLFAGPNPAARIPLFSPDNRVDNVPTGEQFQQLRKH